MSRRTNQQLRAVPAVLAALLWADSALADPAALAALSPRDAAGGLHAALAQGIDTAVAQLGKPGGFLNDPKVAIPLPPALDKADRAMRMIGMSGEADNLHATMNHAAENAVAQAKPVFTQALHNMTLSDAKAILTGGPTAGTEYFRRTTSAQLTQRFRPIVASATARLRLADEYDRVAGKAVQFGLMDSKDANLDDYVTAKALDGLFSRMADEERAIRKNPLGQASSLIRKVFGSL
jgi:Protein of unknown function (DUF4197)